MNINAATARTTHHSGQHHGNPDIRMPDIQGIRPDAFDKEPDKSICHENRQPLFRTGAWTFP